MTVIQSAPNCSKKKTHLAFLKKSVLSHRPATGLMIEDIHKNINCFVYVEVHTNSGCWTLHVTLLLCPSTRFRRLSPTAQPIPQIWSMWCTMLKDFTHMPLYLVLVFLWEGELVQEVMVSTACFSLRDFNKKLFWRQIFFVFVFLKNFFLSHLLQHVVVKLPGP